MATTTGAAAAATATALSQKELDIQMKLAAEVHLGTKNCDFQMERYVSRAAMMMEGVPPSSMDDAVNQLEFETFNMSELSWYVILKHIFIRRSLPEELPVNERSMLCNDQGGQNMPVDDNVINDSFQQTTQFPPSFPQTMVTTHALFISSAEIMGVWKEGTVLKTKLLEHFGGLYDEIKGMMEEVLPSSMDDDFNRLELEKLLSGLPSSPREEVLANQSSILCNDQAVQNILMVNDVDTIQQTTQFPTPFPDRTMTAIRGLDGTSPSWINQNGPNWLQTPSSDQQWTDQLPMSNQVPVMLPQPPMNQCSRQFPYQFNQVPITPNLYDPQCSTMLPEPSQTLRFPQLPPHNLQVSGDPNQGQVNQIDRPNASNAGPDSSLQSQSRGLNTQQVRSLTELSPIANCLLL
ncbi:hypothetical protein SADUNF_Sadunf19G0004500 [Salix dunnii]|uniref:Uncharacterized protein n=1 Tax=Salix dunnii TaxID=1413687 RepID=A0A835MH88_9ROSI|nr:hypothetical protein SADUNF_Sadunf19G0004500 [Salix dunnii]